MADFSLLGGGAVLADVVLEERISIRQVGEADGQGLKVVPARREGANGRPPELLCCPSEALHLR